MRDLANNADEFMALIRSNRRDFIRSLEDFDTSFTKPVGDIIYPLKDGRITPHPLAHLDEATIKAFRDGLLFKDGGLAHADYSMLVDALSFRQFAQLWSFFGMSMAYFVDYMNYSCQKQGDCVALVHHICTSNCLVLEPPLPAGK